MYQKLIVAFYVVAALFVSTAISTSASAEMASAEMLAAPCAGCHGPNGISVSSANPSLAGLAKPNFINAMQSFKNGLRSATVMDRIAKGYTDEEIEVLADYFASQPVADQN